ncbi:hypothetical protein GCM10023187_18400 [Nibrella viscosa]|uniref:Uncharacterized protein n=1 Tax=Nibrella viscosa TaxID=1084524 RepID=A0ABP8K9P5_9BACT
MMSTELFTIPLFFGLNEVDLPVGSELVAIHISQNDVEAQFKGLATEPLQQRRFYVALGDEKIPSDIGVFRHLKSIQLQDKGYTAEVFEVYQ